MSDSESSLDFDTNKRKSTEDSQKKALGTPRKKLKIRHDAPQIRYKQSYRKQWEETFKWVMQGTSSNKARCKVCQDEITADLTTLKKHEKSLKHQQKSKLVKSQPSIAESFQNPSSSAFLLEKKVTTAEIKIVGYLTEHNLPFLASNHLVDLMKDIFPDSNIAQKLELKRTKATCISTNVLGEAHKQDLAKILQNSKFSLLIDEATDISSTKTLAIVVRFFSKIEGKVISKFWNLRMVSQDDPHNSEPGSSKENRQSFVAYGATSERLYDCIKQSFLEYNVPLQNIIGFGSDGCNTMMGEQSSVAARIANEFPGAIIQKCICHSLHLVASEACKQLPRRCEDLSRDIYNFFKSSSKRQSEYKEFQIFCEVEPHKILRPAQTRWLSLLDVVKRINEQWNPLTLFFTSKRFEAHLVVAETIYNNLKDPQVKMYFSFLEWVLTQIVSVNAYFQSEKVVISDSHQKMVNLYKNLLKSYMSPQYIDGQEIQNIDPTREDKFININNMYLGIKVFELLQANNNPELKEDFLNRCRNFLKTACMEIKKRYDFSNELYILINNFSPKKCLNKSERVQSLYKIMILVPRVLNIENSLLAQSIDDEWRNIENNIDELKKYENLEVDEFWNHLRNLKDGSDEFIFPNLAQFVLDVLSLPHSNATCERIFSKINLNKTKLRNRLEVNTVDGILLSSSCIKEQKNCVEFKPSEKMIAMARNYKTLYEGHQIEEPVANIVRVGEQRAPEEELNILNY